MEKPRLDTRYDKKGVYDNTYVVDKNFTRCCLRAPPPVCEVMVCLQISVPYCYITPSHTRILYQRLLAALRHVRKEKRPYQELFKLPIEQPSSSTYLATPSRSLMFTLSLFAEKANQQHAHSETTATNRCLPSLNIGQGLVDLIC